MRAVPLCPPPATRHNEVSYQLSFAQIDLLTALLTVLIAIFRDIHVENIWKQNPHLHIHIYQGQQTFRSHPRSNSCCCIFTSMNPHISIPRQHGGTSNFGGNTTPGARKEGLRMPRFFKRLFKFPQMDFEMAIWEMTSLLIAPKKVFRSIYYHVRQALLSPPFFASCCVWCMLTSLRFRNVNLSPPRPTPWPPKLSSFCRGGFGWFE